MAEIKRADVLSYLEKANMVEVSELIKDIEDKFGVTAAAPVAGCAESQYCSPPLRSRKLFEAHSL